MSRNVPVLQGQWYSHQRSWAPAGQAQETPTTFLLTPPQSTSGSNDLPCSYLTMSHPLQPELSPHKPCLCPQLSRQLPQTPQLGPCPHCPRWPPPPETRLQGPLQPEPPPHHVEGVSERRKGRAELCLPEMTVTGTGSQHAFFINLRTTESRDSISAALHTRTQPPGTLHPCSQDSASGEQGGLGPTALGTGASSEQGSQRTPEREARSLTACPSSCPRHSSVQLPYTNSSAPQALLPMRAPPHPMDRHVCFPEQSRRGSDPHPGRLEACQGSSCASPTLSW